MVIRLSSNAVEISAFDAYAMPIAAGKLPLIVMILAKGFRREAKGM
jgi:hypothetical protein